MKRKEFWLIIFFCFVISSTVSLLFFFASDPPVALAVTRGIEVDSLPTELNREEKINIQIYESVSPAVVNITSTSIEYNWFFDIVPRRGIGSGSIIDNLGHVVTNYHVVEGARHLEVRLHDKTTLNAELVGSDPPNDLALLKIDCPEKECSYIKLGESAGLRVGQNVLAIGNPFGLQHTLTTGIISSTGRSLRTELGFVENVIQTDAAINPGNSGGPLLNTRGQLIGINTAIFSRTGESAGIGFAIPVDTLSKVLPDLIKDGEVKRAWIGLRGRALTARLAGAIDAPVSEGFLVERVEEGSTADLAKIRGGDRRVVYGNTIMYIGGDILVKIDGHDIRNRWDILRVIQDKRPGETVELVSYRKQRKREVVIELVGRNGRSQGLRF